jgi:hypothetical protein
MKFAMILYQIIYVRYVATDQAALTHDSVCGLVDIPAIKSSTISYKAVLSNLQAVEHSSLVVPLQLPLLLDGLENKQEYRISLWYIPQSRSLGIAGLVYQQKADDRCAD